MAFVQNLTVMTASRVHSRRGLIVVASALRVLPVSVMRTVRVAIAIMERVEYLLAMTELEIREKKG